VQPLVTRAFRILSSPVFRHLRCGLVRARGVPRRPFAGPAMQARALRRPRRFAKRWGAGLCEQSDRVRRVLNRVPAGWPRGASRTVGRLSDPRRIGLHFSRSGLDLTPEAAEIHTINCAIARERAGVTLSAPVLPLPAGHVIDDALNRQLARPRLNWLFTVGASGHAGAMQPPSQPARRSSAGRVHAAGGSLCVPDIQTGLMKPYPLAGRHVDLELDLSVCNRLNAPIAGTAGPLAIHSLRGSAVGRGGGRRRSLHDVSHNVSLHALAHDPAPRGLVVDLQGPLLSNAPGARDVEPSGVGGWWN